MKTKNSKSTKTGIAIICLMVLVISAASRGAENQVTAVSPNSANPGDSSVSVTFTLDTGNPPAPPAGVIPDSVTIDSIAGYSVAHPDQYTITALFDFPADQAQGTKDVVISFTTPQGDTLQFTSPGGFTVGQATDPAWSPYEGYNLFSPMQSTDTYLMDNEGNILRTWTSGYNVALSVYLLEDGTLLRTANNNGTSFQSQGGGGGMVEQYDWQGNLIWSFEHSSADYRLHHDIEMMPNGNVLMIAWQLKTYSEAIAAGRDPSLLTEGELWPDYIIEVEPDGAAGGNIVWQWHVWDHLVQDYDASKANYGVVADNPGRINLNYAQNGAADWNHINSIDYNPDLDQIVLSVRNFSEIWIIDHNTTTAEAAGPAGDLLYRWGNPRAYDTAAADDQQLFVQHDAEWIETGLPGAGDILIFNNGQGRPDGDYSSVVQVTPPLNPDGSYTFQAGSAYAPTSPTWTYPSSPDTSFYASRISGSQRLADGHTLICQGTEGRLFEVDSEGNIVWEYDHSSEIFRVERYSPDYPGFIGTELEPEPLPESGYPIVDTGQAKCYDDSSEITPPAVGEAYYGQDAQFDGKSPSYTISADGLTVTDNVTGLTWTGTADTDGDGDIDADDKFTYSEALNYPAALNAQNYGGYNDWRLPGIKELYSLMNFTGRDPSGYTGTDTSGLVPFIDTDYFDFGYGDQSVGERIIDAQWASSTLYESTTMNGSETMFGLNLADGRIKGYPTNNKTYYVYLCRGNTDYGINNFVDNGDGTVSDKATGLMWSKDDSGPVSGTGPRSGMNWSEALAWVQSKNTENYLGYSDWRLPNAKEMHSIVDYSRSPDTTASAAIDPVFNCTRITNEAGQTDYPWYWTGTTHANFSGRGQSGAYICFGRALGCWGNEWQDVHGAGCQRSDRKSGDLSADPQYIYVPDGYYFENSPQGDAARINNYVRLVRDTQCGQPGYVSDMQGDLDGDCRVNYSDISQLGGAWKSEYEITTLADIAANWLACEATDCN